MAEGVAADAFVEFGGLGGLPNGALDDGFVEVVAAGFVGFGVEVVAGRREEPLPGPFAWGVGELDAQRARELDASGASLEIFAVLLFDLSHVEPKAL